MPGTKFRPKADAEQIRKVGDLLRTNAGIDVCAKSVLVSFLAGHVPLLVIVIANVNCLNRPHLYPFFRKDHDFVEFKSMDLPFATGRSI
jgi:hypothetical protein